jgi:hypothetical protein
MAPVKNRGRPKGSVKKATGKIANKKNTRAKHAPKDIQVDSEDEEDIQLEDEDSVSDPEEEPTPVVFGKQISKSPWARITPMNTVVTPDKASLPTRLLSPDIEKTYYILNKVLGTHTKYETQEEALEFMEITSEYDPELFNQLMVHPFESLTQR